MDVRITDENKQAYMLTEEEKERYSRHLMLAEIGEEGQQKLRNARVLVVGAGGLGSPALLYLTAAGIGTIGMIDDDMVSGSNLQRQVLYDTSVIGTPKTAAAVGRLSALNPECRLIPHQQRLEQENADGLIAGYDLVVDATDNLSTRYLINDVCVAQGKPFIYGSICEFDGQVSVFNYQGGPAYRDLYAYHEGIGDFRQSLGVVGALPGVIGSLQASEAIKVILGRDDTLSGTLLLVNLLECSFRKIGIKKSESGKNGF